LSISLFPAALPVFRLCINLQIWPQQKKINLGNAAGGLGASLLAV